MPDTHRMNLNQWLKTFELFAIIKDFIAQYFTKKYSDDDLVEVEYDYVMIQKMLLKYAFNDMRSHK